MPSPKNSTTPVPLTDSREEGRFWRFLRPDAHRVVTWLVLGAMFPAPFALYILVVGTTALIPTSILWIASSITEWNMFGFTGFAFVFGILLVHFLFLYAFACFVVWLLRKRSINSQTVWWMILGLAVLLFLIGLFPVFWLGDVGGGRETNTLLSLWEQAFKF